MSRGEKTISIMGIFRTLLFSVNLVAIIFIGRECKDLDAKIDGLEEKVYQTKESLAVLEPYRGMKLQLDEDAFNVLMAKFENDALLGDWPAGEAFDDAVLPLLYKFYVAASLDYMPREVAFSYVLRARNFVGKWPVTYARAQHSVEALYSQLQFEIYNPPKKEDSNDRDST